MCAQEFKQNCSALILHVLRVKTNISSLTGKAEVPLKAIPQGQKIAVARGIAGSYTRKYHSTPCPAQKPCSVLVTKHTARSANIALPGLPTKTLTFGHLLSQQSGVRADNKVEALHTSVFSISSMVDRDHNVGCSHFFGIGIALAAVKHSNTLPFTLLPLSYFERCENLKAIHYIWSSRVSSSAPGQFLMLP